MKKIILFVVGLILLSFITNAQGKSFDESSRLLNVGVGLGHNYYSFGRGNGYVHRNSPVISISYEQPLKEKIGPGYLGVGGYLGFRSSSSRYDYNYFADNYYYKHVYRNFLVGARAAYHFDEINAEEWELYFGAIAGLRIQTYKYRTDYTGPDIYRHNRSNLGVGPALAGFVGARWYFTPKAAIFGEFGYGVSYITIGVTLKV